jgi:hypothetical protein
LSSVHFSDETGQSITVGTISNGTFTVEGEEGEEGEEGAGVDVVVSDASGAPGQSGVTVSISVNDATGIAGGDLVLSYDPEVLTATQVRATALTSGYLVMPNLTTPGTVNISLASAAGHSGGSGAIVEIAFDVRTEAEVGDSSALKLTSVTLSNEMAQPIAIGGISDGTFCVEITLPGDFDGDGQVSLSDFSLFVGYYGSSAGDADFDFLYDLDGDGMIGLGDFSIFAGNYGTSVGSAKGMPGTGENHPAAFLSMERMDRSEEASGEVKWAVCLNGVRELKGYSFKVRYDPGRFDFRGAKRAGEVFHDNRGRLWPLLVGSPAPGEIVIADVVWGNELAEGGVLVELCFKDKRAAEDVRFTLAEGMFMDVEGELHTLRSAETVSLPHEVVLLQNFPNPFNASTVIRIQLPEASEVTLIIRNATGQMVRTLVDERKEAGRYVVVWDSVNDAGKQVAAGVYLYELKAGDFVKVRKMALIR